jgi:hypothetical protein
MPREILDRQIQILLDDILILGSMVETATLESVESFKKQDLEAAIRMMP